MTDIKTLIEARAASDPRLKAVLKKIKEGTATFKDTAYYAEVYSSITGKVFSANVLDLVGTEREEVCEELLRGNYEEINNICAQVQTALDEAAGIHIKPQRAAFPTDRVDQIAHSLLDPTVKDSVIKRRANTGVANVSQGFHDSYIKVNASFRNDSGLKVYINRETDGKCCEWCTKIAGRYSYGTEPDDIYRRHDNCGCTVTYENGKQRQDVWSKRSWTSPEVGAGAPPPTRFTPEQAAEIQARNMPKSPVKINNSSLDNSGKSDIISSRGSGKNPVLSDDHSYEKIGEIEFSDKKAIAHSLAEFESKYQSSDIEHCRVICPNGDVYEVHGDRCRVNTGLLGDKMVGSINDHNHVTGESQYSFSWEDISSSAEDGSHIVMAYDEKYRYSMTFPNKAIDANALREAYDISETEVDLNNFNYQYYSIGSRISDEDHQHEIIKRTCERVGVKYERKLKT